MCSVDCFVSIPAEDRWETRVYERAASHLEGHREGNG